MADNRRPALPLAAVPKLAQPLVLSYPLLQHTHFARYVNFEFSNLIPLKKSEYSEAHLAMQPFDEQAAATFKISASNDWH